MDSNRLLRYPELFGFTAASHDDVATLERVDVMCVDHSSGGSYDMAAMWCKGSRAVTGVNRLHRKASTITGGYPEVCGQHAELNLWANGIHRGGVVYVAGRLAGSGARMMSTVPCVYCAALLTQSGVRRIVCFVLGEAMTAPPRMLIPRDS